MLKKLRAWTLIETLVVVAIVAILAALVLPITMRGGKSKNGIRLHDGDRVEIVGLGVKGVVDRVYYNEATVIVHGTDGFPVKLEHVKLTILRKYN